MNRGRIEYLDLYRALAILAVLAIHTTSTAVASLPTDSLLFPVYLAVNAAANFAVPSFLFLSSLVLFYNYDGRTGINWRKFYVKRLSTVIIPYVLWSFFYFLLVNRNHGLKMWEKWPVFLNKLVDGSNYTHLYFLVILLQFFILFPLFLRLTRLQWVRSNLILLGIVLQTAFYLGNYYLFHLHKVGTYAGPYLLYFFLGAHVGILLKSSSTLLSRFNPALYAAVLLLGAAYVVQIWMQKFSPNYIPQPWLSRVNFVSVYAYCSVCCLFLIHVSARLFDGGWFIRKFLMSVGVASFGIYLMHPAILYVWRSKLMMNGPLLYHVLTWGGGIVALLVSWIVTLLLLRTRWGSMVLGGERGPVKMKVQPSEAKSF